MHDVVLQAAVFHQVLVPVANPGFSALLALVPVLLLLVMLAGLRLTGWIATPIAAVVTFVLGVVIWHAPPDLLGKSFLYGVMSGFESIAWIAFWGVVIYNTLVVTGAFASFQNWLVSNATADVRVQAILLAWAFGALLEGLVGLGVPWSVVAPILVGLGVVELDALRVAAIANNAPVSYGGLGVPIISLATVTGLPLLSLSASVGRIVAILALFPPWILIYLVSGWKGIRGGWPLAIVGSFGYIIGQFPVSQFLGPYLPDITGSLVCFAAVFGLIKIWKPSPLLGYGGVPLSESEAGAATRPIGGGSTDGDPPGAATPTNGFRGHVMYGLLPFIILILVVIIWTGPWSPLPNLSLLKLSVTAVASLGTKPASSLFQLKPFVSGTAVLLSWLIILAVLRPSIRQIGEVFSRTWNHTWAALLIGLFVFGLAFDFNYSGMASSLAYGFSRVGIAFIVLAPILGWLGCALSGSNASTNTLFGQFQLAVGNLLHFPVLLLPSLSSVGSEIGKPVAVQTASVGVSTSGYLRKEGAVIRHNMAWTLVILAYLIVVGIFYLFVLPGAMRL